MTQTVGPEVAEEMQSWVQERLDRLVQEHGVPGASAAISVDDEFVEAASGVVNLSTAVPTTTESVFQIGSVTKVVTATVIMQLAEEGKLDLDDPVRKYVPEFQTDDLEASRTITVRHLLTHTAGFEGDVFVDTGRGDDAISRLVGLLKDTAQISTPGELFSYNNAGFVTLGRIVEVLRGQPFDTVLRERVADPLGLSSFSTSAEEAILRRAAVGHFRRMPDGPVQASHIWSLPRSNAPAGATLSMSAGDLVRFGRMHLRGGRADDGTAVLGEQAVADMQAEHVPVPFFGKSSSARGLGWAVQELVDGSMIGHDGGTVGQYAFLRIVPSKRFAVALLTNGGSPSVSHSFFVKEAAMNFGGVEYPESLTPAGAPMPPLDRYLGIYSGNLTIMRVRTGSSGSLWVDLSPQPILADIGAQGESFEILPLQEDVFLRAEKTNGVHEMITFLGSHDDGRASFLHTGRIHVRQGD